MSTWQPDLSRLATREDLSTGTSHRFGVSGDGLVEAADPLTTTVAEGVRYATRLGVAVGELLGAGALTSLESTGTATMVAWVRQHPYGGPSLIGIVDTSGAPPEGLGAELAGDRSR